MPILTVRFQPAVFLIIPVFVSLILGARTPGQAQTAEGSLKVFQIFCDPASFEYIYAHPQVDTSISATLTYDDSSWSNLKLSILDDSSRDLPKKSLRIEFSDQPFLEGSLILNFNAAYLDESYIQAALSSLLMQQSGYPVSRVEHTRLNLNGKYLGLYILTENVDELFLSSWGLDPLGNLYEAVLDGACLSIYDDVDYHWAKRTNNTLPQDGLLELIDSLNSLPESGYLTFIQSAIDYEQMVNLLALNMLLANGSTYYRNYYLFHDIAGTSKWTMLPGDLTESLASYGIDYSYQRSSPDSLPDNPFVERALINPDIVSDIRSRIVDLSQTVFNNQSIDPVIDSLRVLLVAAVQDDTTDLIPDTTTWIDNLQQEKDYVQNRVSALLYQIDNWPRTFRVDRISDVFTDQVHLSWHPALDPNGHAVSYTIEYDTSSSYSAPTVISDINDIVSTVPGSLAPGVYYWRVKASDGTHEALGWDSWNLFRVKAGTSLPDTIFTEVLLTKESSPYMVTGDVRIEAGGILRADGGVEIRISESAGIHVAGELEFNGTDTDPIRIRPDLDADCWIALNFNGAAATLSYVQIERALGGSNLPAAINADNSTVTLDNLSFIECRAGIVTTGGNLVMRQCHFPSGNGGEAVNVVGGVGVIEECEIYVVPGDNDGIDFDGVTSGTIRDNLIVGIGDDGIDVGEGSSDILITGNRIYDCIDKGISIGELSDVRVEFNTIAGCDTGIAVKDDSYALITRSTLYDNYVSIGAYNKFSEYGGGYADVHSSILAGSRGAAIYTDGLSVIDISYSLCDTEELTGTGNLYADPLFIDPSVRDFSLQANSPAIDAGRPDAPLDPDSTRADMGAYTHYHELFTVSQNIIPAIHKLYQNYPNPFNPVSTIRYDLPQATDISLIVYDILGREMARLVDGYIEPGYHQVQWDGRNANGLELPSGMYIARVETPEYSKSIKMVLLR